MAPRVNRESSHRNSYRHEVLVLVMGPVSQPRRSFLLASTGNTDGGCGVTVQNGPHLGKSQPGSTFVYHRISPHLSTVFVLLQMMLKKLTKSFCIFVSNIFRKILFSSLQIIPVICLSILELTLTYRALMHTLFFFISYYGLFFLSSLQSSLWKLTLYLKFSFCTGVNFSF